MVNLMQNRRDFLKSAVLAGAVCSAVNGLKAEAAATGPAGAPMLMLGFRCKPMERIRVGVVDIDLANFKI